MMNKKNILMVLLMFLTVSSFAQKTLSEGTIVYDVVVNTGNKEPQMADALDGATTTVYLKGSKSRTDMVSALGTESNIYDSKTLNDHFIFRRKRLLKNSRLTNAFNMPTPPSSARFIRFLNQANITYIKKNALVEILLVATSNLFPLM